MSAPKEVFLSYSRAEKKWAEKLSRALPERGLSVWYDDRELRPGDDWTDAIEAAVRAARAVLFLIGRQDEPDRRQELEWQTALESAWSDPLKRLVPVLVEDAKLPPFLQNRQALQLGAGAREWTKTLDRIVAEVSRTEPAEARPPSSAERAQQQSRLEYIEEFARGLKSGKPSSVREKSRS